MKKIFTLLLFLFITHSTLEGGGKKNFAIGAIFQNEAPYLQEWIDYHLSHGVSHFFLYNNNSEDDFRRVLAPYIANKVVDLIEWPSIQEENDWEHYSFTVQTGAYNDAVQKAKGKYRWLALIDVDEYILSPKYGNILKCLTNEYDSYGGVCVNWIMYGTTSVEKAPPGKMVETLLMRAPLNYPRNLYCKSIVKPKYVTKCRNPHFCFYKNGYFHVNGQGKKIDANMRNNGEGIFIDKIRINHYWTKDNWFLENIKIPRYVRWGRDPEKIRKEAAEMNVEFDDTILHH